MALTGTCRRMIAALAMMPMTAAVLPPADPTAAQFAAIRDVDMRMAGIGHRLVIANRALCRDLASMPGMAIHAIDQYDPASRETARRIFGFEAPVAVEGVVPQGAAARAGVRANDAILAVNGRALPAPVAGKAADAATRDAAQALIAGQDPNRPLVLTVSSGGVRRTASVAPSPGCRSRFEVLLGPGMSASADGDIVQLGVRFFERYDDTEIAVVVAHELAHNILRHRARLDAAGISRGLFSEVGRNGRLIRRTENEADILGLHLLRNAGYDPVSAVRFWREHGGDVDGGLFRSRTHASSKARAEALAAEIAHIPAGAPRPYAPPVLATQDEALQ